ncbi:MAG: DNA translocase FtsK 4TM domain-containing protein [Patescibacteria group bacterium]
MPADNDKGFSKLDKKAPRKPKKSSSWLHLESGVKRSVAGIILLAVALVTTLAFFGLSGSLSAQITEGAQYLFGSGSFFVPLTLFLMAFFILISEKKKILGSTVVGGSLLILSFLGILDLLSRNHSGGEVGYYFGWPFMYLFGFWGSLIFFTAFFFSAILVVFRIPLKDQIKEKVIFKPDETGEMVPERKLVLEKGLVTKVASLAVKAKPPKKSESPKPAPASETVTINSPQGATVPVVTKTEEPAKKKMEMAGGFSVLPISVGYKFPPLDLLEDEGSMPVTGDIKANAIIIQKTLENFNIPVEMSEVNIGPAVTQFTLKPATGVKLAKITALQNDLSLALAVHPIRIEAPIPGKSLVGIEIPNQKSMIVRLKGLLQSFDQSEHKNFLNVGLGKDVSGRPVWASLARMPHLLIAGATGSGKSVAINSLIVNLLYQHSPEILRFIMVDPKRVELTLYNGIPHLLTPVIVEPKKVVSALRWAVSEMERRYTVLSDKGVRDIASFNSQIDGKKGEDLMPYLVIIVDELADLMAAHGREIEGTVVRLAQMARAVGIHLVLATQRPSVEVITGLIKANITTRVAFSVASQIDSRTILDSAGAEKLLGMGDMLFITSDSPKPKRIQGSYVSEKEVKKVVGFIKSNQPEDAPDANPDEALGLEKAVGEAKTSLAVDLNKIDSNNSNEEDELLPQAKEAIMQAGKASASLLQRRLRVGYARAARLLDILEAQGIVGPGEGAKPREVLIKSEVAIEPEQLESEFDKQNQSV